MMTSVTRPCVFHNTTPELQDQDQHRFFWSQTGLVLKPTVSDHITALNRSLRSQKHYTNFMKKATLFLIFYNLNKLCGRPPQYASAPRKLIFDLLTLKVVSESRVTWATSVPILVFLGLCSRLRPDVLERQASDVRRASSLNAPTLGAGHN